jgi:hypothetical protein
MAMKRIILLIGILAYSSMTYAQHRDKTDMDAAKLPYDNKPVYNPYQLTNYYQNNSSFVNNSMQTNRPANTNAGPYTGNADYQDPSRAMLFLNKNTNSYYPANNNNAPSPANNAVNNSR